MKSKPVKWIGPAVTTLVMLMALAVVGAAAWLYTGPRQATFLTTPIERALTTPGGNYRVSVGDTIVDWGGFSSPLNVKAENVRIIDNSGINILALPEISVGVKFWQLLLGKLKLTDLMLQKPELWLMRSAEGGFRLGMGSEEQGKSVFEYLLSDLRELNEFSHKSGVSIESLSIVGATLTFGDQATGVYQKVPNTDIHFISDEKRGASGSIHAPVVFDKVTTDLLLDFQLLKAEERVEVTLRFDNLLPPLWTRYFPQYPQLKDAALPLEGEAHFGMAFDGSGKRIDFTLKGGEGTVTQSEFFAEPLRIAALEAKGAVTNDLVTLEVESSMIDFHGPLLKASGSLTRKEQSMAIALDATAEGLPVEELYRYWPVPLAAKPREWVTTRITKGIVPHAHAKLVLDTADIVERHIPAEALAAEVEVEGATIRYLDALAPAENAKGVARFTGKGMDIAVSSATMYTEAKLKSGRVQIPDMTTTTPEMLIDLSVLAPGQEVAQYLDNDLFFYTKMLNLVPETTSGIAEGDIKLRFSLNNEVRKTEGVAYDIKATLKDAKAQKFMESMDIDKGDFILAISRGKAIDLEGTASINTLPVGVVWHTDLSKNEKFQQSYRFKAQGDMSQFGGFGLPPIEGASGSMTMDATIQQSGGTRYIDATIDLTQMVLELPKWQYSKAAGETGALTIKGTGSTDNSLNIQNFTLTMPEAEASGTALIASKPFAFEMLNLNRFRMGRQDFSLRLMEGSHNDFDVTITGSSLDLGQMLEEKDKEKKSAMPDMNITLDVAQLLLGGKKTLPNVEGTLECKSDTCATIDTTITFDNGRKAVYKVSPGAADTRTVSLTSEDAGKLIGALNITDKLYGGVLDLSGTINDGGAERTVVGRIMLANCRLIKAPVMAKILALSSLSGIAAALEGDEGVFFKKMAIPYTMKGNVFSFNEALASGPSVGVSANGAVNIDTTQLDINGTLIPSNVLNTLVGKVPLVGETIVGGEGEGLFATSFKVEGTYEDAKVSANPLSMLTPGLLRNVFGDEVGDVTGEKKPTPETMPQGAN